MSNIKIAELESGLLNELSATDLEVVYGGAGAQFTGSSSGTILGFSAGGGSTSVQSQSFSILSGTVPSFNVNFGTVTTGFTSPF
ncbi:MAG: hypothetical protein KME60_18865 [Cyanomargarita calcarea GSE-NOS-MK-12-04C]|jgi:hypothetical protein|uniref:Uncharacterized protein n=1 Tax=Cyanomargarita calcarea GSE-NOS-MK-12-04C TaxID=2839659 RepID=A0A951UT89_9CYAN|nr:hypothetical protein [Cyanomargarita calcarea GSE-NOS-MK-12-04C]